MWINPNFPDTQASTDPRSRLLARSEKPNFPKRPETSLANVFCADDWQPQLLADIEAARHVIVITALSMLPPRPGQRGAWPDTWRALCARAAAGIDIELTLPRPSRQHAAAAQNAKAATAAHAAGWSTRLLQGPRLLHAKQYVIDDRLIWIGSANLTCAAYAYNHERMVRIESHHFAEKLTSSIRRLE